VVGDHQRIETLLVGRNGPVTPSGICQVALDRAWVAGLPAMYALVTGWLVEGGNENELILAAGWKP
jgi:hypothetical protein